MDVLEFRKKVKPDSILIVGERKFQIEELVKFRLDDGTFYIKCYLNDGWVFADDEYENMYLLVRPVQTPFEKPFLNSLIFDNKKFNFLFVMPMPLLKKSPVKIISKREKLSLFGIIQQKMEAI